MVCQRQILLMSERGFFSARRRIGQVSHLDMPYLLVWGGGKALSLPARQFAARSLSFRLPNLGQHLTVDIGVPARHWHIPE